MTENAWISDISKSGGHPSRPEVGFARGSTGLIPTTGPRGTPTTHHPDTRNNNPDLLTSDDNVTSGSTTSGTSASNEHSRHHHHHQRPTTPRPKTPISTTQPAAMSPPNAHRVLPQPPPPLTATPNYNHPAATTPGGVGGNLTDGSASAHDRSMSYYEVPTTALPYDAARNSPSPVITPMGANKVCTLTF